MANSNRLFHITCILGAAALMALSQNSMGTNAAYAGPAASHMAANASQGCTGVANCYIYWPASNGKCSDNPPSNASSVDIECLGPAGNECPGSGGKLPNGAPKSPNLCADKCKEVAASSPAGNPPGTGICWLYTKPGSHGGPTGK